MNVWRDLNQRMAPYVPIEDLSRQSAGAAGTLPAMPAFVAPPEEEVGPNGRTYSQITGTDYLSPEERIWYLERTPGADPAVIEEARAQFAPSPAPDVQGQMEQFEVAGQQQFSQIPNVPNAQITEPEPAAPWVEAPPSQLGEFASRIGVDPSLTRRIDEAALEIQEPGVMADSAALLGPALGLTDDQRAAGVVAEILQKSAEATPNYESYKNVYGERDFYGEATDLVGRVGGEEALRQAQEQYNKNNALDLESLGLETLATAGPFAALRGAGLASRFVGRGAAEGVGRFMAANFGADLGAVVAPDLAEDLGLGIEGQVAASILGGIAGGVAVNTGFGATNVARNIANPQPPKRPEGLGSIIARAGDRDVTVAYWRAIAEQRGIDVSDIPTTGRGVKQQMVQRFEEFHAAQKAETETARSVVDQIVKEGLITPEDVETIKDDLRVALGGEGAIDDDLEEIIDGLTQRVVAQGAPLPGDLSDPKLPRDLAGASPSYKMSKLKFESDLDKAAYIIAATQRRSSRDADYVKFLMDNVGVDEATARRLGRNVRTVVGTLRPDANGVITVPRQGLNDAVDLQIQPPPPAAAPPAVPPSGAPPTPAGPRPPSGPPPPGGGTQPGFDFGDDLSAKRPWSLSVRENIAAAIGVPQTLAASTDVSSIGRQAAVMGWRNPKEWLDSSKKTLGAFWSGDYAREVDAAIKGSPLYDPQGATKAMGMKNAGLHFWEFGPSQVDPSERVPGFTALNNSMLSNIIEKYPGVTMSERAYATGMNVLGSEVYEKLARNWWKTGMRDPEFFKEFAKVINHGRGYGDYALDILPGLNLFFSGRRLSSYFNVIMDPLRRTGPIRKVPMFDDVTGAVTGYAASPRRVAAENLAGFIAGNMALLAMLGMTGAMSGGKWAVEFDPRESSGGQLKIGETKVDPWAGFGSLARLVARAADEGVREGLGLEVVPKAEREAEWKSEVLRFFRNKASPVATTLIDLLVGETAMGKPPLIEDATPERIATELFTPFLIQDVVEAFKETEGTMLERALTAAGVGTGSAVGLSAQTYQTVRERQDRIAGDRFVIDPLTGKPRERLDGESGPGPRYTQLLPSAQQKIREEMLARGLIRESDIAKSRKQFEAEQITEQQQASELAFLQSELDSKEAMPEIWSDLNTIKFGASSQRAIDYAKSLADFPENEMSKLIEEYFAISVKYPNTQRYDPGASEEARQKYLEELKSREAPKGSLFTPYEVLTDYLATIDAKKSPLEQDYRAFIDDLGSSGYYDLPEDDRPKWMADHPEYDAQQAFWYSGIIGEKPPKLETLEAAEYFKALNATYGSNHPIGIASFSLPITPKTEAAWQVGGPLVEERYLNLPAGKERTAAGEDPWINAWLFYLGYNVVLKTAGPGGASEAYRRLVQQYGDNGIAPEFAKEPKIVNTPLR